MSKLQSAIRYSLEGPLHKAIRELEEILHSNPAEKTAALYLADVHCRLGRYEDAISLFSRIRQQGYWDGELESERQRIAAVWEDLKKVEKIRFRKKIFLSHAIVPNGRGGYYVDTLGFPGTWDFQKNTSIELSPGAYLRLFKSLAWITQQIRSNDITLPEGYSSDQFIYSGGVFVEEYMEGGISISFLKNKDEQYKWQVAVDLNFLFWERERQRRKIIELVTCGSFHILTERQKEFSKDLPQNLPRMVLISPGLSSDYAITILRDRSLAEGIPTAASYIRSYKHIDDYIGMYENMPELDRISPDIFAIGVLDVMIEEVCVIIDRLRRRFPDTHIILGGPTSQTPEQFAAVVPDFDVLIRGDGDEILPTIAKIIGRTSRVDGFSEAQLAALKELPGGLIVQHKNRRIIHRLDFTNIPKKYHLPRPDKKKTIYYWQTSRGCPYDCRFCYKWSGKRYHMAVPWEDDPVELSLAKRSALAMKEFLLSRLSMEWPDGISIKELEKVLRKAKTSQEPLILPNLSEKIFIVIVDDDFLINRERVKEFRTIINELGLQSFFHFSAITSVRTLFRGEDTVDREILEWLKDSNFISLDIGSDGLCQHTIEENQKGYTLDRHVIPLNALLKDMGFFAFNNTIITTPYTTIPQFIESLIFYILCPYPINAAIQFGIMGHIGTKYTNEDIVNQQYDWRGQEGERRSHAHLLDRYLVPEAFPEYALNNSHMIGYADPKVFELVLKLPRQGPIEFFNNDLPEEEVEAVVKSWIDASDDRPETKALGKSISLIQNKNKHWGWDFSYIFLTIKEEMSILGLSSFTQYYERIKKDTIRNDAQNRWIFNKRWNAIQHQELKKMEEAEKELKLLVEKTPWYFRPHQELIVLLGNRGKISNAVEHFSRYQVIYPDILFYFMFFNQFLKAMRLDDAHAKERALFHLPRYYTISPIYYFLALLKEFAGEVRSFCFSKFSPRDVEHLYDLFDYLTIDMMKKVVSESGIDISAEVKSGREIYMMGIPVKYSKEEQKVFLDYNRIRPDLALEITIKDLDND